MGRGAWQATVHGVARVRHDLELNHHHRHSPVHGNLGASPLRNLKPRPASEPKDPPLQQLFCGVGEPFPDLGSTAPYLDLGPSELLYPEGTAPHLSQDH